MTQNKKKIIIFGIIAAVVIIAIVAFIVAKNLKKGSANPDPSNQGIQQNDEQPDNILVFEAQELTKRDWNNGSGVLEDGKMKMTFPAQYDEVILMLPEEIDLAKCQEVIFTFESQSVPLALKLRNGETETSDTVYNQTGSNEYKIVPASEQMINAIGIMVAEECPEPATATLLKVTFVMQEGYGAKILGENIIKNPDFEDEASLDAWTLNVGSSSISAEKGETAIYDNVTSYGKIDRDPSTSAPGDCFSQDITDKVENGEEYQFEFYAMLSDDYKNAPDDQRTVCFAPYIVVDGQTTYLGSYSTGIISGESSVVLTPGEWKRFKGTFKVSYSGNLDQLVIRILEEGTEYGSGVCVKGDYYVTGVSLRKVTKPQPEIQKDIPNWKDAIVEGLGDGTIAAYSLMNSELSDEALMELVTKHCNAITLGNELKPDCTFGYSNDVCPGTEMAELNGETIEVPVMDHSLADKMLDVILEWNQEHPNDKIAVRGHVLVWHSQTPEWFFHENYDASQPYVTPEEMDKRQEWYIKSMLEYYVGESSPYKDLFYGWDVVNEAVSDNSGTYRNASEGSSWWKVYENESYIINAFRYANKYAPETLELYYNDYNECVGTKKEGIITLLKAVKAAEGAPGVGTRISGMGMQGHYDLYSPTVGQIESAAKEYAQVVGSVQLTELDLKANGTYDGTSATRTQVYNTMAYRYKEIYDTLKNLKSDGVNVTGITIWGVIDTNSWLNDQATVGGGTDGKDKQCPLLFDGDYQAKPAFWAFVDPSMLEPAIRNITLIEYQDDSFAVGNVYSFEQNETKVSFVPMWTEGELKVKVTVVDATEDESDCITVYLDENNTKSESDELTKVVVKRQQAVETDNGYEAIVNVPVKELMVGEVIGFDVQVTDGAEKISFNDLKQLQDTSSIYYAEAIVKPYTSVSKGTITVDGEVDEAWANAAEIPLRINLGTNVSCVMKLLWDEENLYMLAEVKDPVLNKKNSEPHQQDSVEIFIDENNHKADSYEEDDKQYRVNYENYQTFNGKKCKKENIESFAKVTSDGYIVEAACKWTDVKPFAGMEFGLELQVNDADDTGLRLGTLSWYDTTGTGWTSPAVYGNAILIQ